MTLLEQAIARHPELTAEQRAELWRKAAHTGDRETLDEAGAEGWIREVKLATKGRLIVRRVEGGDEEPGTSRKKTTPRRK